MCVCVCACVCVWIFVCRSVCKREGNVLCFVFMQALELSSIVCILGQSAALKLKQLRCDVNN